MLVCGRDAIPMPTVQPIPYSDFAEYIGAAGREKTMQTDSKRKKRRGTGLGSEWAECSVGETSFA